MAKSKKRSRLTTLDATESQTPTQPDVGPYRNDKERYENRCQTIFKAWEKDRKHDKCLRITYAIVITLLVLAQIGFVYWIICLKLFGQEETLATQTTEVLGIVGAILAESFGVFYLVVKYFFGKRPEDLEKISTFFLKCHPSRFGANYRKDDR